MLVFGIGDGGGGPQPEMLERLSRAKNVDGLPRVAFEDPTKVFERIERDCPDLVEWKGELYFELHRGTYTSQAWTKRYNRTSEFLLRAAELASVFASSIGFSYPIDELTRLWKMILLNQ